MTTYAIPLTAVPSQIVAVQLGAQGCRITVRQRRTGLFVDLYVNDVLIVGGMKAENLVRMVRDAYLGFTGDLFFADTQGTDDPDYTGLGGRFVFCWDDGLP